MRMNQSRKSARILRRERLKALAKSCAYQPRRPSGLLEQTDAPKRRIGRFLMETLLAAAG
jgi:hypothetical protein